MRNRTPDLQAFTLKERRIIASHRTPHRVQAFFRLLPYNWERGGETLRTFRGVVRRWQAHCLEAALTAAAILDQHGYPPLLLDLESKDELDHDLFLFREGGLWGTVARSRDASLHGRRPVFRTVRDLVMSYVDPYVNETGRITGYGIAPLDELVRGDWRLSERNVWEVQEALRRMPHHRLVTSDRRYRRVLRKYLAFVEEKRRFTPRGLRDLYGRAVDAWW